MTTRLDDELTLPCGATIGNRIFKSAMTEGMADRHDRATERHVRLYRAWSEGGAGLLVTGNVMVDRRFLERPGNVVIDDNGGHEQLRRWAEAGTVGGNHLWMQISHPGRQCQRIVNSRPLAPSEVPFKLAGVFGHPRAMSEAEIEDVIARFAHVARVARETGFTGVQVHGAHGYLLSEFLSPIVNRRTDDWGGPLENRARLLLKVVRAVRRAVGDDFPISVKLNSADFQKRGFNVEESAQVASWLRAAGLDMLEISGGTYEQLRMFNKQGRPEQATDAHGEPLRESTRRREAYFLDYVPKLRAAFDGPLGVTGGFRTRDTMIDALTEDDLDLVGLARPMCTDPAIPRRLLNSEVTHTEQYEDNLRLGNGWLGPNSASFTLKMLNNMASVVWYYRQMLQIADDKPLRLRISARRALIEHYWDDTRLALRRKRADHRESQADGSVSPERQ